nr:MAG TPA: hypothetical protein [Caudoviricetes sp.]
MKSLKQVYFFIVLLLGSRAVWAFYRSQFFKGNRCNEPQSYFSIKAVKCGCLFCMQREDNYGKDKRRYLWVEEDRVD